MNAYADHVISYLLAQSWQIALLAGMVGLISWVLRDRSAHIRYLLWLIVLAKCLVPPFLTVPLEVLPEGSTSTFITSVGPPEGHSMPEPFVSVRADPGPQESQPVGLSLSEWIALVWVMGAFSFLLWVGGRAIRYNAWLRDRRRPLPPALEEAIQGLSIGFKLRRLPRIWLLEDINQPFVWGVLRGGVYLPAEFTGLSGSDRQRSVLAHELSHVARFDAGVNLLQVMAQAVFWFHPFVWWMNKKIRQEREKCCDEMAIVQLNTPPEQYTEAIVDTLVADRRSAHPIPSLAIVGSVKDIEERIRTMLKPGKTFHRRPSLVAATVALLIALVTIPTTFDLIARGASQPTSQNQDKPAAVGEKSESPPFAARTFNSTMPFEVLVQERGRSELSPRSIGRTPSAAPLEIPACVIWWVRPIPPVQDWEALIREIGQGQIPGLMLDSVRDFDMRHLADFSFLKGLRLSGLVRTDGRMELTDAGLAHLQSLTGLQILILGSAEVTDAGLVYLKGLTRLQSLRLGGARITDEGLAHLKDMKELRSLGLYANRITDAGLVHLKDLRKLEFLNLSYARITDAGLMHLKGLTSLRTLTVDGTRVTDAGLAHLQGMTGLRRLVLAGNKITDMGLEHLKSLNGLNWLNLSGTQITNAGLAHLKEIPGLLRLDLSRTQITDTGLAHLKGLPGLWQLNLSNTQITDAGLAYLEGLTTLTDLNLSGTQVTDAGIQQLKQGLPKLTVVRDQAK